MFFLFSNIGRARDLLAGCSILLLVFFIPYSTALVNLFSAICLVCWLSSGFVLNDLKKFYHSVVGKILLLFLFISFLSILWSEAPKEYILDGFAKLRKFILLAVVWMLLARLREFQKLTLCSMFLSFSLLTLICLGIYAGVPGFPNMTPGQGAVFLRSHIAQGYFLSLLVCVCAAILFLTRGYKKRLLGLTFLILSMIVTFYMTNGRTGYVCLVCSLLVMAIMVPGSIKKKSLLLVFTGVVIATTIISSERLEKRWDDAVVDMQKLEAGNGETSIGYRLRAVKASFDMVKERPWLGAGLGSWGMKFCQFDSINKQNLALCQKTINVGNPHSDYLNWLSQFGIPGLILWLAFLFCLWKRCFRLDKRYRAFVMAALASYMVGSLFNSFMWDISEGTASALMFGWILAVSTRIEEKGTKQLEI